VPVGSALRPHGVFPMATVEVINDEGLDFDTIETTCIDRDLLGVRAGDAEGRDPTHRTEAVLSLAGEEAIGKPVAGLGEQPKPLWLDRPVEVAHLRAD